MAQAFVRRGLGVALSLGLAAVLALLWVWLGRETAPALPGAAAAAASTTAMPASATTATAPRAMSEGAPQSAVSPGSVVEEQRALSVPEWLAGHAPGWRMARLAEMPEVLVIEFPDLSDQGAAMNRLAAFVQKAGAPRDRVLNPTELASLIAAGGDTSQSFYQGHDYTAAEVARFFDQARAQDLALNPQEARLQLSLRSAGMLPASPVPVPEPTFAPLTALPSRAPLQAVVTFTATQADDPSTPVDEGVDALRREAVLRHEISHGRFYTQAAYREHCRRFWQVVMTPSQRDRLRSFLSRLGYDVRNELLMINEAQAFLMHTPDPRAFSASAAGLSERELAELRAWFWRHQPAEERR